MIRHEELIRRALLSAFAAGALALPYVPPAAAVGPNVDLVITRAPGASAAQVASAERATGATVVDRIAGLSAEVIRVPAASVGSVSATLRANPAVDSVEVDVRAHATWSEPTDPYYLQQWGLEKIRAPQAWETSAGSTAIVIAMIDTGVQADHPDLVGQVLPGYDFVNNDSDPSDDYGHGTETAGVVAAKANNGVGIAGICPGCRILPVKVLDATGSGALSDVAAGIVYATDSQAQIINLSLGCACNSPILGDAVSYAQAHGVLVVAAAGNNGNTSRFYPAAFPGVISVAATDYVDQRQTFSSYGSWVTIAAPGCVFSTYPTTMRASGLATDVCGTSFAAPMVAATAGLMLSADPIATASELAAALVATAVGPVTDRFDPAAVVTASGRLDADAAVRAMTGQAFDSPAVTDPASFPSIAPGGSLDVSASVTDVYGVIPFATTSPESTVNFHLTSLAGEFKFLVRSRLGGALTAGQSAAGTWNFSFPGLVQQPYTIEIRPVSGTTVSVAGTIDVDPLVDLGPMFAELSLGALTDATATVSVTFGGGNPGYWLDVRASAWQPFIKTLDSPGTATFDLARSCAADMLVWIQVIDQAGWGEHEADTNTISIPKASGCPAPPFSIAATVVSATVIGSSEQISLAGVATPPGIPYSTYYYQWREVDAGTALGPYLPDQVTSWFSPNATITVPCDVLAELPSLVVVAYSESNTNLAAASDSLTLPVCESAAPSPTPTASPTPDPTASPTPDPTPVPTSTPTPEPTPTPTPAPTPPADVTAPTMTALSAPSLITSADGSFAATFAASDNVGVANYEVRTRRGAAGTWSAPTVQHATARTFIGLAPGTWYIDVRARDAVGNLSAWRESVVVVPTDDRAWSFSAGTTRRTGSSYLRGTATTTQTAGARMKLTFSGSSFSLLGTAGRSNGRMRINVDGHAFIVDTGYYKGARATGNHYRVVLFSRNLTNGKHAVTITCLATAGRRTIGIDAAGWRN